MEGSGEVECMQERMENDDDDNNSERKINGGSSSNNSCVEESSKKPSVRPYVRSKTPRLRWTPDLHMRFLQAVERLGGQERATPKLVLQLMNIKGLNIAHVKSHLQMHRSKKFEEPSYQGMIDHRRLLVEGVDRNIFNLSQLPLLPNFNQRYGDVFRNGGEAKWMDRTGFYERMLSSHCCNRSANLDLYTKLHKQETSPFGIISSDYDSEKSKASSNIGQNMMNIKRDVMTLKRKTTDCELGLSLTLGPVSRNHDQVSCRQQEEEISNLSLSLYTSTSSSSSKFKKLDENRRGVSTLDLTL